MAITIVHISTSITDDYDVAATFAPTDRLRGAEVVRASVELTPAEDDHSVMIANVDLVGYELTAKGNRDQRRGSGRIYGDRDVAERWDVVRDLITESVTRHHIDPSTVEDVHLAMTFDQYQARLAARYAI